MRVFLDRLYLFSGYLAGAFMLAIFVLMMLLSAGRPIGLNIPAADDFVSWCMAAMAFLGLAHTFRNGEMIRVGLLIDKLPDRSRHWIEIVCLVIGIGFIGFFAFYAVPADSQFLALPRDVAGRDRDPDVDSADRLCRRADHPADRVRRRIHPCAARQSAALREAEAARPPKRWSSSAVQSGV